MKYAIYILVLACVFACMPGCASHYSYVGSQPYVAIYAAHADAAKTTLLDPRDGDWHWAGTAPTLQEAATRWEKYLNKHYSDFDGEDGVDYNRRETAKYELMRIYYLLGDRKKGDEILKSRDPLELLGNPE